jgi:hypothetical protein
MKPPSLQEHDLGYTEQVFRTQTHPPAINVIKFLFSLLSFQSNKLERLSLRISTKAEDYLIGQILGVPLLGRLLALPSNIWKDLSGTNTLAFTRAALTKKNDIETLRASKNLHLCLLDE